MDMLGTYTYVHTHILGRRNFLYPEGSVYHSPNGYLTFPLNVWCACGVVHGACVVHGAYVVHGACVVHGSVVVW